MSQLAVSRDDDAVAEGVKLRPPGTTKDLKNIKNTKVHKCSFLCIIDLSTLYSKRVGGGG